MTEQNIPVEMMEVEVIECSNSNDFNSEHLTEDVPPSVEAPVEPLLSSIATFTFIENELFNFLNLSLEGTIILGKYRSTRNLDYARLKDLIILNEINKDPICYKIKPEVFIYLRDQIKELFPTEDPNLFYVPCCESENKEFLSARGCLYNHYKVIRKELREAEMLSEDSKYGNQSTPSTNSIDGFECLNSPNRELYCMSTVVKSWEDTYIDRMKLLLPTKKTEKPVMLECYFSSFACLKAPLSLALLEQDCQKIFHEYSTGNEILRRLIRDNPNQSIFQSQWPELAKKIIAFSKKSQSVDVKSFRSKYKDFLKAGSHDNILALLLLPLLIKAVKIFKIDETRTVTLKKEEVSKSFILQVEIFANLPAEKQEFEAWLKELKLQIHPYLILAGNLQSPQFYVVVNGHDYTFQNPLEALDACHKCLTALKSFPSICDFVWGFIDKAVFNIEKSKLSSWSSKPLVDINK